MVTAAVTVHLFIKAVALLSYSNLRYVTAEKAGKSPLVANRAAASSWERPDVIDAGDGSVALRARVNGQYVTVDPNNRYRLVANATTVDTPALFRIVTGANGIVSLRSVPTGKYLSSNNGTQPMAADRAVIGRWEQFYEAPCPQAPTFIDALVNASYVTAGRVPEWG